MTPEQRDACIIDYVRAKKELERMEEALHLAQRKVKICQDFLKQKGERLFELDGLYLVNGPYSGKQLVIDIGVNGILVREIEA